MKLSDYLTQSFSALSPIYQWSIDQSWSGSTYINFIFGTESQEDDGLETRTSIRFADHKRPAIVSVGGVNDHSYLQDFRIDGTMQKGLVDAIILYSHKVITRATIELSENEDDYLGVYWNDKAFRDLETDLVINDNYSTELLEF